MILRPLIMAALLASPLAAARGDDAFHESLTLHPLPDGKLSVLFEFSTYFTSTPSHSSICERLSDVWSSTDKQLSRITPSLRLLCYYRSNRTMYLSSRYPS